MVRGGRFCVPWNRISYHDVQVDRRRATRKLNLFHRLESHFLIYRGIDIVAAFEVAKATFGIGLSNHVTNYRCSGSNPTDFILQS